MAISIRCYNDLAGTTFENGSLLRNNAGAYLRQVRVKPPLAAQIVTGRVRSLATWT
ncbi:MAG: hypothetical protein ABSB35_03590 [Bryobacteraceae bacterium]|jgi:hypothetical protein